MIIICDQTRVEEEIAKRKVDSIKELVESFTGAKLIFPENGEDGKIKIFMEGNIDAMKMFMVSVGGRYFHLERLVHF